MGVHVEPTVIPYDDVSKAANKAAEDVLDAIGANDQGVRDVVNLVVNATLSYAKGEADCLEGVVWLNYDESLDTVLEWCAS